MRLWVAICLHTKYFIPIDIVKVVNVNEDVITPRVIYNALNILKRLSHLKNNAV